MFLAGVQFGAGRAWYALPLAMVVVVYARLWQEKSPRRGLLFLLIFTLFAAGALRAESESRLQASYLPEFEDGQQVRLVGEITRIEERERCVCYRLTDCVMDRSNEYMPCNDVLAYASSDEFSIGQILVITGTISLFEPAANEGGFDVRSYYQSQKIDFGVWVDTVEAVHGTGNRYSNFLMKVRKRLSESIAGCQGIDGILSAMLLGEKSQLDEEIKSLYRLANRAYSGHFRASCNHAWNRIVSPVAEVWSSLRKLCGVCVFCDAVLWLDDRRKYVHLQSCWNAFGVSSGGCPGKRL